MRDLNRHYGTLPALHQLDSRPRGFDWIEHGDAQGSVIAFLRRGQQPGDVVVVVCNLTPVVRQDYPVGRAGAGRVGGGPEHGRPRLRRERAEPGAPVGVPGQGQGRYAQSLRLTLPPLGVLYARPGGAGAARRAG